MIGRALEILDNSTQLLFLIHQRKATKKEARRKSKKTNIQRTLFLQRNLYSKSFLSGFQNVKDIIFLYFQ